MACARGAATGIKRRGAGDGPAGAPTGKPGRDRPAFLVFRSDDLYCLSGAGSQSWWAPASHRQHRVWRGVAGVFWLVVQPPWSIPASTWNPHTSS